MNTHLNLDGLVAGLARLAAEDVVKAGAELGQQAARERQPHDHPQADDDHVGEGVEELGAEAGVEGEGVAVRDAVPDLERPLRADH